ncbi:hypothetical protein HY968_05195 [Candidatus Kaiserbacteria bacterium]|nr:hypothetical protein [Candidatus Kaiserbacteria bacterium]
MEPPFDFDAGPEKIFVDKSHLRIINGLMNLTLQSGDMLSTYILPLPLAKQISRAMGLQIEEIEKNNNIVIDGRLSNEPMLSPIKPDETKGGDK